MSIDVIGAGITGLWQALTLARTGHNVRVLEASKTPFETAASALAGAMLAPFCEAETAEPLVHELGLAALPLWLETLPDIVCNGSLVVANARDRTELKRFARLTHGHAELDGPGIAKLEPDLDGRFASGLFFADEAHMAPLEVLHGLVHKARAAGVKFEFGVSWNGKRDGSTDNASPASLIIDCRGMAARNDLPTLRGVRGERILIRSRDVQLSRPIRLLHPRHPLYIVPWPDTGESGAEQSIAPPLAGSRSGQVYMIGSTLLESDDTSAMTVRSALEILGLAYALHPAFGEAEIIDMSAGVRPAFPDNCPKIIVRSGRGEQTSPRRSYGCIHVNGMYRHGFLVAPMMAKLVADYIATGTARGDVFVID